MKRRSDPLFPCQNNYYVTRCWDFHSFLQFKLTFLLLSILTLPAPSLLELKGQTGTCAWTPHTKILICSKFRGITNCTKSPSVQDNFMEPILAILGFDIISDVETIYIDSSFIPAVNLTQFQSFPSLQNLSIHSSSVCSVWGELPKSLKYLSFSDNVLMIEGFALKGFSNESQLEELNFSYNKFDQLPNGTLELNLKKLYLIHNDLKCNWITKLEFYNWASKNKDVIQDIDDTFCRQEEVVFGHMTILGALKVRETALEECQKINCGCDIYTTKVVETGENSIPESGHPVHVNKYGKVYMTLEVDCSNMGLTELPTISPFTVAINLDNNLIRDLSRLNIDEDYAGVTSIKLNHNEVESLEAITSTKFFDRVQVLEMKNNSLSWLTDASINAIFSRTNSDRRIIRIYIGDNKIYCNCNSLLLLKPTLINRESIIQDWKTLQCRLPNVALQHLKYEQACQKEVTNNSELPWWIVAGLESILIAAIIIKLWSDRRQYRKTGQLPSFSSCMPRLPCDFMLEGVDTPKGQHTQTFPK